MTHLGRNSRQESNGVGGGRGRGWAGGEREGDGGGEREGGGQGGRDDNEEMCPCSYDTLPIL